MLSRAVICLALVCLCGLSPADPGIEAVSLLGKELRRPTPPPAFAAEQESAIAALRALLRGAGAG